MVLRQMLHITQCIIDELHVFVNVAGGPQEKCYRIFVAMMNVVAYDKYGFKEESENTYPKLVELPRQH